MANTKLNSLSFAQAQPILSHYRINYQCLNTDLDYLNTKTTLTQATVTQIIAKHFSTDFSEMKKQIASYTGDSADNSLLTVLNDLKIRAKLLN